MLKVEGAQIVAIADNHAPSAEYNASYISGQGFEKPVLYTNGDDDYLRLLDRPDIDAVIIATPWSLHVPMSVAAMRRGKHAFVEVPAATTTEDCWELVQVSEETQRHCMMLENVCYGREEMAVLSMCRAGVFGELLHGEASYLHDLRSQLEQIDHGSGSWRSLEFLHRNGNLYPTHGLGPVCQYMNINRGDRLDYVSSVSSNARARNFYVKEHLPVESPRQQKNFICGDVNTSILRTVGGRTIMLQWDEQLPRPYSRHNFIQGTRDAWGGFPNRIVSEGLTPDTENWVEGEAVERWLTQYEHPFWLEVGSKAIAYGGHGGADFVMLWRTVFCHRNGLPLDQDVYDAATWSVLGPLTEQSVATNGRH